MLKEATVGRRRSEPSRRRRLLLAASSLALVGGASSCGLLSGPGEHLVQVDSLQAPVSAAPTAPFEARFFGIVGSDGCSRLTRIERTRTEERLTLRFHAERRGGDCIQMPVLLDHTETISPPFRDPFTITVIQPSGPPLERSITVR